MRNPSARAGKRHPKCRRLLMRRLRCLLKRRNQTITSKFQRLSGLPASPSDARKAAPPSNAVSLGCFSYLKEFRVDQCPLFVQHKCTQHKPFTCFHWHFKNQRRRRPVRIARDGTFNYSPDVYCTNYDETTGICPDGDG